MKLIKKILSKIFSKKSLIIATSLLAILLIAIVTTHIIYNAKAKKHWANTKQAWTEYLGENDRQQRFPKVPAEQDFLQHPTIKADLAAKPEDKITSIFEMEFKNFDFKNPYTRPRTDEDWLTIIKGKTFTSRNESATFLLNALQEKTKSNRRA